MKLKQNGINVGLKTALGVGCMKFLQAIPDLHYSRFMLPTLKAHSHACGAVGGNQDMTRTKGGLIPRFILLRIVQPYMSVRTHVKLQIKAGAAL